MNLVDTIYHYSVHQMNDFYWLTMGYLIEKDINYVFHIALSKSFFNLHILQYLLAYLHKYLCRVPSFCVDYDYSNLESC